MAEGSNVLAGKIGGIPVWTIVVGGGLIIGVFFVRRSQQMQASADSTPQELIPPTVASDSSGSPFGGGNEIIVVPTPTPITTAPSPQESPPRQPSGEKERGKYVRVGVVRAKGSKDSIGGPKQWDATHPGVPLWNVPGGKYVDLAGFGSTVQITGGAVSGPTNLPGNPGLGSTTYYPTARGYINDFDLAEIRDDFVTEGTSNTSQSNSSSQTVSNV